MDLLYRAVPVVTCTDAGLCALSKAQPIDPASVPRYVQSKCSDTLDDAYAAMQPHPCMA